MDLLLILTYAAVCVVIFKVFDLPLNKWTVPTAVLGGVVLIGTLIFAMNYNHPYSEVSREYFVTTPIVPGVSGIATKVHVEPNQRLDKDDIMFQIDPIPYENKVKQLNAQLVAALDDQVRAKELMVKGVGRQRDLDIADAQVDSLEAQMNSAQYDLSRTTVRAPGNGYVTQFSLRPGIMAVSMPLRPVAVFVQDESGYLIAWFRQNSMQRLQVGYEAEAAYDGIPGTVFKGEILAVLPVLAEGQIQPTGNLMTISSRQPGRIPVRIRITDERLKDYTIPGGAYAQTAAYSDHLHYVAIMRRILLRMSSWMNYLFPFH
ncbi:MAG: HlyD family secretion protein [Pseudomonadales bacterium]|jgi:multidrug resistance efflux pump|tara:strand:- start:3973 stop:4923 length:951 start_codon:yes stop_codon:yes gene_type:complete